MSAIGVAQKAAHRLAELVYLDSFLPESGKSLDDYLPAPHLSVDGRTMLKQHPVLRGVCRASEATGVQVLWVDIFISLPDDYPARRTSENPTRSCLVLSRDSARIPTVARMFTYLEIRRSTVAVYQ
jgi:hypothetical protein